MKSTILPGHTTTIRIVIAAGVDNGSGLDLDALGLKMLVHRVQHLTAEAVLIEQMAEAQDGRLIRRRSHAEIHADNRCNTGDSYNASSTPESDKSNHCCTKYVLSVIDNPTGCRPLPAFA